MWTVSSLAEVPSTLRMPSSRLRRVAASSKRAAAASHGLRSFSVEMAGGNVTVATLDPPVSLWQFENTLDAEAQRRGGTQRARGPSSGNPFWKVCYETPIAQRIGCRIPQQK